MEEKEKVGGGRAKKKKKGLNKHIWRDRNLAVSLVVHSGKFCVLVLKLKLHARPKNVFFRIINIYHVHTLRIRAGISQ